MRFSRLFFYVSASLGLYANYYDIRAYLNGDAAAVPVVAEKTTAALSARDAGALVGNTSEATFSYLEHCRRMALDRLRPVDDLSPFTAILVLALRRDYANDDLASLTARDILLRNKSLLLPPNKVEKVPTKGYLFKGDQAIAVLKKAGSAEKSFAAFRKENGVWRYDLLPAFNNADKVHRSRMTEAGQSVEEYARAHLARRSSKSK